MWANKKSIQRDALTKEKQALMRTGGGPPEKTVEIDPDVAQITPHLMAMAPVVLFSSNVRDEETINNLREPVINEELPENVESLAGTITVGNRLERENVPNEQSSQDMDQMIQNADDNIDITQNKRKQRRSELEELNIKRIKYIIEEEERFNRAKFEHELLKQKLEIEFLKEKYKLELEAIQKGNICF